MKIYIIYEGWYEPEVDAVFVNEQIAYNYCSKKNKEHNELSMYTVYEMESDEEKIENLKDLITLAQITINYSMYPDLSRDDNSQRVERVNFGHVGFFWGIEDDLRFDFNYGSGEHLIKNNKGFYDVVIKEKRNILIFSGKISDERADMLWLNAKDKYLKSLQDRYEDIFKRFHEWNKDQVEYKTDYRKFTAILNKEMNY